MKAINRNILLGFCAFLSVSSFSQTSRHIVESEFVTDSLYSNSLLEYRKHNVYLPKDFDREKQYPIIYATDGNSEITEMKEVLDSLIANEVIKPLIFVASFSNDKVADSTSTTLGNGQKISLTYRNFEYVDRLPTRPEDSLLIDRFQNHKTYFINELITEIEKKYNQDHGKMNRYFYGVSNGAGFGMSLLNSNPEVIGTYFCFSTFGGDIESNSWNKKIIYPNLYLKYGSDEHFFLKNDAAFLKVKYKKTHSFLEVKEFKGGHNNLYWNQEFIEIISKLFR